jgi:large subunit ribosomal protein L23
MAIFSKKDKKEEKGVEKKAKASKPAKKETKKAPKKAKASKKSSVRESKLGLVSDSKLENVIQKPRITEKAAVKADVANAYTFEIDPRATKTEVAAAIEKIYKVVPVKVNITKIQRKAVGVRRGKGFKGGGKKAVVYLKKGDSIEFV